MTQSFTVSALEWHTRDDDHEYHISVLKTNLSMPILCFAPVTHRVLAVPNAIYGSLPQSHSTTSSSHFRKYPRSYQNHAPLAPSPLNLFPPNRPTKTQYLPLCPHLHAPRPPTQSPPPPLPIQPRRGPNLRPRPLPPDRQPHRMPPAPITPHLPQPSHIPRDLPPQIILNRKLRQRRRQRRGGRVA